MKAILLLPIVAALGLAACASTGGERQLAADKLRVESERDGVDYAYMERVNRDARKRGIVVQWVNPPQYRAKPSNPPATDGR